MVIKITRLAKQAYRRTRRLLGLSPRIGEIVKFGEYYFRFLGEKYDKAERKRVQAWRCFVCCRTVDDVYGHIMHERREREDWAERCALLRESIEARMRGKE